MSEEAPPFSCPHCGAVQPMSSAWMLTKFSELNCKSCDKPIKPKASSVPRMNAIPGLLGGLFGILIYSFMGNIGYWFIPPIFIFVCLANCFVVSRSVSFIER